jgi:hypothetical protein
MPFKIRMPEEGEIPDIELHATYFMSSDELESQAKMELEKENDV